MLGSYQGATGRSKIDVDISFPLAFLIFFFIVLLIIIILIIYFLAKECRWRKIKINLKKKQEKMRKRNLKK
jgi:hypothetical protein